jgi:hypothetical protein
MQCVYCDGQWTDWMPQPLTFEEFVQGVEACRAFDGRQAVVLLFTGGNHFQLLQDPRGPASIRASLPMPMRGLTELPGTLGAGSSGAAFTRRSPRGIGGPTASGPTAATARLSAAPHLPSAPVVPTGGRKGGKKGS